MSPGTLSTRSWAERENFSSKWNDENLLLMDWAPLQTRLMKCVASAFTRAFTITEGERCAEVGISSLDNIPVCSHLTAG